MLVIAYFKKRYAEYKDKNKNRDAMKALGVKSFNYAEDEEVNRVFDKLFEIPWSGVEFGDHYVVVTTVTDLVVHIWSSNAYHAWASQGYIRRKDQNSRYASRHASDNIYSWYDAMPSAWRMLEMEKRFKVYKRRAAYGTIDQIFEVNAVTNKSDNYIEEISVKF